jgi:hypothetical protein
MINQSILFSNWSNGVIMISVFAIVCLVLIGFLFKFMLGGKKNDDNTKN